MCEQQPLLLEFLVNPLGICLRSDVMNVAVSTARRGASPLFSFEKKQEATTVYINASASRRTKDYDEFAFPHNIYIYIECRL